MYKIGQSLIDQILNRNCFVGMGMQLSCSIPMTLASPPYGDVGPAFDWVAATAEELDVPSYLSDLGFEVHRPPDNPE